MQIPSIGLKRIFRIDMFWILPLIFFTTSCAPFWLDDNAGAYSSFTQPIDPLAFSEVIIPYAVELRRTKRLRLEDSVVYYNDHFAERYRVIFSSQEILELCECRHLMVSVTEGLLERMNASPGIVDAFDHFPITADDLEFYFSFESYDIEFNDGTYIAWMSLHDGMVRYLNGLVKNPRIDFWDERMEPYYKSLQFVQIENAALEYAVPEVSHSPKPSQDSHMLDI